MIGPAHYRAAEECLKTLGESGPCGEHSVILMAEAQVHATLALAAATALHVQPHLTERLKPIDEWRKAGAW